MQLTRHEGTPEGDPRLIAVVPSPTGSVTTDAERLFDETYRRRYGEMLTHAERFLSRTDAEDAVGDAMEVLWRRWPELTPDQRTDKWAFGIVQNCVFAKLRANQGFVSLEDAEDELEEIATRAVPSFSRHDTLSDVIDRVVAAMPTRRRQVFILVREHGLTYEETAAALGLSIGTINTHIRLANADVTAAYARGGFRLTDYQPQRLPAPKGGAKE